PTTGGVTMALSGLDIYKLLPRTNCKKCGQQTCLAFAMQLAKKAVSLDKCPFVADEVRQKLEEASLPAIREIGFGAADSRVTVGHETVLFRHEEKFHNPTVLGVILEEGMSRGDLEKTVAEVERLRFERVGQVLAVEAVALRQTSESAEKYADFVKAVVEKSSRAVILMPRSAAALKAALASAAVRMPLVSAAGPAAADALVPLCKEAGLPLTLRAEDLASFAAGTQAWAGQGFKDIVLELPGAGVAERLWLLTQIRRLAIKKGERRLGYPVLAVIEEDDPVAAVREASAYIAKYAGIVLVKTRRPEYVLPLLTLRQNIFTDPQKPLQVEPRVYQVGAADRDAPVLITTNFSLTYYTVLGEIEASRVPSHLICVDTEGMSVLTAWAAEKFTPERIADSLSRFHLGDIVAHKDLIIPGYVAMMSGELEDKSGWTIHVGPREASALSSYLKNFCRS
ncbi:MAG: acetyl-CoA decarbonylase/synthase complex subunit gamma, partial [Deltaproteobacteria bacterium]